MGYQIHILGQEVETVVSREEAVWRLGSKYGGVILNKSNEAGAIVWTDRFVKVNPDLVQEVVEKHRAEKLSRGLRL